MATATLIENEIIRGFIGNCEVRNIDIDNRAATFVAATENGVETFFGRQHLRVSGARFGRFRKNNVVLDTHARDSVGVVIGNAVVKTLQKERELETTITFAETERAEEAWLLVRTGFVKAISVGFIPDKSKIKVLQEGETDGEGDGLIEGPAEIIRVWELLEISVVPVPADQDALRRAFLDGETSELAPLVRALVHTVDRLIESKPTTKGNGNMDQDKSKADESQTADATSGDTPIERTAEPVKGEVVTLPASPGYAREEIDNEIRSIAPKGMERIAEDQILGGATVEQARAVMIEERKKTTVNAGHAPPEDTDNPEPEGRELKDITDKELVRALVG